MFLDDVARQLIQQQPSLEYDVFAGMDLLPEGPPATQTAHSVTSDQQHSPAQAQLPSRTAQSAEQPSNQQILLLNFSGDDDDELSRQIQHNREAYMMHYPQLSQALVQLPVNSQGAPPPTTPPESGNSTHHDGPRPQDSSSEHMNDTDFDPEAIEALSNRRLPSSGFVTAHHRAKGTPGNKPKPTSAQQRMHARNRNKLMSSEARIEELRQKLDQLRVEQQHLASRNAALEQNLNLQQQQDKQLTADSTPSFIQPEGNVWWLDAHTQQLLQAALGIEGEMAFTIAPDAPLRLTCAQVADMSLEDHAKLWRQYIEAYASCLVVADGDINSPAGQRLKRLVYEAGRMRACIALKNPQKIHKYYMRSTKAPDASSIGVARHQAALQQLLKALALTPDQRKVLTMLRNIFFTNLGVLLARRRKLTAELQGSLPVQHPDSGPVIGPEYLQAVAAMDKLRGTWRDENCFFIQFIFTVWRQCFTPFQAANLNIQAHPQSPDILALINFLAVEEGEPSYEQLLKDGAEAGDGTVLLPLDAAVPQLPATLSDFGVQHVAFSKG